MGFEDDRQRRRDRLKKKFKKEKEKTLDSEREDPFKGDRDRPRRKNWSIEDFEDGEPYEDS